MKQHFIDNLMTKRTRHKPNFLSKEVAGHIGGNFLMREGGKHFPQHNQNTINP